MPYEIRDRVTGRLIAAFPTAAAARAFLGAAAASGDGTAALTWELVEPEPPLSQPPEGDRPSGIRHFPDAADDVEPPHRRASGR